MSRWLSGERNPSIETMNKIAQVLETTTAYLFSESSDDTAQKPAEEKSDSVNWGAILAGTALTATAVIAIVALAKATGKLNDKDKAQITEILNRE